LPVNLKKAWLHFATMLFLLIQSEPVLALRFEALTAVDGTISAGLERYLGLTAAAVTDHGEHLPGGTTVAVLSTAGSAAGRAAARLVLEALLSKELLLAGRENEFVAAVTAGQGFVFVHGS
jgi:hypothetical protein